MFWHPRHVSEPSQPVRGDVSLNCTDSSFLQDLDIAHFVVPSNSEDMAETGLVEHFYSMHLGLRSVPGLTSIE